MAPRKNSKTGPLSNTEVDSFMTSVGPFENKPHIAVAVSGGADSLALTLLCNNWVKKRGGKLSAISVNHDLRKGSADEIKQLGEWLAVHAIEHITLNWKSKKPRNGLQDAARIARYNLLESWCRENEVFHLLLGHHQDDQAETFLLRLAHKSGIDGLAGMSSVIEKSHVRLLRPLLTIPKSRLYATLEALTQPWLEDPSNKNEDFERVRIRNLSPKLSELGLTREKICETADCIAHARIHLEAEASKLLAKSCYVGSAGYVCFDAAILFSGPREILLRALTRALLCVGGGVYPPRLVKLQGLYKKMRSALKNSNESWKGATLAGCRILLTTSKSGAMIFLLCREERSLPESMKISDSLIANWDNRFQLYLTGLNLTDNTNLNIQPLGRKGWSALCREFPSIINSHVPHPVSFTLPTLVDNHGILAVPNLNYRRANMVLHGLDSVRAIFRPRQTLSGSGFSVAK